MVVPVPSYSDIGKAAKDLLGKDYPVGTAKMEFTTTSASGVVFSIC
jgi:voltage-dependent anion channel protein 2